MLPMVPFAFPVPSYASEAFLDETTRFFQLLAPAVTPLLYPEGPIVLVQVDNEGALYFRDGAYDQDYHPDAVRLYRAYLRDKYPARGADEIDPTLLPPGTSRFDAETPADLARHLDWAEFHEHLLAHAFDRFGQALAARGHRRPPHGRTTSRWAGRDAPQRRARRPHGRSRRLDYYSRRAPRRAPSSCAARASSRCAARASVTRPSPARWAPGFPPFFPPLDERDSAFTLLTALAYGLRGFNLYMAVERDRWIGAPIDPHGRERPFAVLLAQARAGARSTAFFERFAGERRCASSPRAASGASPG
jgi:beta-galactosidase